MILVESLSRAGGIFCVGFSWLAILQDVAKSVRIPHSESPPDAGNLMINFKNVPTVPMLFLNSIQNLVRHMVCLKLYPSSYVYYE